MSVLQSHRVGGNLSQQPEETSHPLTASVFTTSCPAPYALPGGLRITASQLSSATSLQLPPPPAGHAPFPPLPPPEPPFALSHLPETTMDPERLPAAPQIFIKILTIINVLEPPWSVSTPWWQRDG